MDWLKDLIEKATQSISKIPQSLVQSLTDKKGLVQEGKINLEPVKDTIVKNITLQPGTSAYSLTQPIRDLAPKAMEFPFFKPIVSSARQLYEGAKKELYQPSPTIGGFAKNVGTPLLKTTAQAYGLSKVPELGVGGLSLLAGIGAALSPKGKRVEGALKSLEQAPTMSAVGSFTNPLISTIAKGLTAKATSPLAKQIASRGTTALLNIPETIAYRKALTGKADYSPADLPLDITIGILTGGPSPNLKATEGINEINKTPNDLVEKYVPYSKKFIKQPVEESTNISKELQPTNEAVVKEAKEVKPITQKVGLTKTIPKRLEPLAEEARKYKSAEEFAKHVLPPGDITPGNKLFVKTKEGYIRGEVISFPIAPKSSDAQIKLENGKVIPVNIYQLHGDELKETMGISNLNDFYDRVVRGVKKVKPEGKVFTSIITTGRGNTFHAGDWEIISETPKSIKLKLVKEPESILGEIDLNNQEGKELIIKKDRLGFEKFDDGSFQFYPNQKIGIPLYFEPKAVKGVKEVEPLKSEVELPKIETKEPLNKVNVNIGGIKKINTEDELASALAKEFNKKAGEGVEGKANEVIQTLKNKGYIIDEKLLKKIEDEETVVGKNFSISLTRPFQKGELNIEVIFDEGFKPKQISTSQGITGKKRGVKLPTSFKRENIQEIKEQPLSPNLEKQNITVKPVEEASLSEKTIPALPGEVVPLTPKQAVSIYKKTGEAYPFLNQLKDKEGEPIRLTEKAEDLATTTERKGDVFNANDIKPTKDLGTIEEWLQHPRRLIERLGDKAKDFIINFHSNQLAQAKRFVDNEVKPVKEVLEKYNIKKGSSQERLLFDFADGKVGEDEVLKTKDGQNIIEAAKVLRGFYDNVLNKINEVRRKYGLDEIARRDDYITHLVELKDKTKEMVDLNFGYFKDVVGDAPFFKFGQKRKESTQYTKSVYDAVDAYSRASVFQIALPPIINRYKLFSQALLEKGLPNFAKYVMDTASYLQKGLDPTTAALKETRLGKNVLEALDSISNNISKNLVLHNISAAISNFTQAATFIPSQFGVRHLIAGIGKTLFGKDKEAEKIISDFLRNREQITTLNESLLNKIEIFSKLSNLADRITFNSLMDYALKKGMSMDEATKFADDWAAKIIGERAYGLTPRFHREKGITKLISMFTLEPINAIFSVLKDVPALSKNKGDLAVRLGLLFLFSHIFNNVTEKTIGRRFAFDPIYIATNLIDIWANRPFSTDEKMKASLNVFSRSIPLVEVAFGKGFAGLPITAPLPTQTELEESPLKAAAKFGLLALNPYGGGYQVYKIIEGLDAWRKGAVTTAKGQVKYPVRRDLENFLKLTLFGKASVPEAREYYDLLRKPLSPKQSAVFFQGKSDEERKRIYDGLMFTREVESEVDKVQKLISDMVYLGKGKEEIKKKVENQVKEAAQNIKKASRLYKQKQNIYERVMDIFTRMFTGEVERVGELQGQLKEKPAGKEPPSNLNKPIESDVFNTLNILNSKASRGVSLKNIPKLKLPQIYLKAKATIKPSLNKPISLLKITPPPQNSEAYQGIIKSALSRKGIPLKRKVS